jgi:hypothetical protein
MLPTAPDFDMWESNATWKDVDKTCTGLLIDFQCLKDTLGLSLLENQLSEIKYRPYYNRA